VDIREGWGAKKGDTLLFNKISRINTAGGTLIETNVMPENKFSIARGTITLSEWGETIAPVKACCCWDVLKAA